MAGAVPASARTSRADADSFARQAPNTVIVASPAHAHAVRSWFMSSHRTRRTSGRFPYRSRFEGAFARRCRDRTASSRGKRRSRDGPRLLEAQGVDQLQRAAELFLLGRARGEACGLHAMEDTLDEARAALRKRVGAHVVRRARRPNGDTHGDGVDVVVHERDAWRQAGSNGVDRRDDGRFARVAASRTRSLGRGARPTHARLGRLAGRLGARLRTFVGAGRLRLAGARLGWRRRLLVGGRRGFGGRGRDGAGSSFARARWPFRLPQGWRTGRARAAAQRERRSQEAGESHAPWTRSRDGSSASTSAFGEWSDRQSPEMPGLSTRSWACLEATLSSRARRSRLARRGA